MALVNSMSFAAPIALGALGASVGIVPVFWTVGACLATAGLVARPGGPPDAVAAKSAARPGTCPKLCVANAR
jgi:hypothetical protein